MSVRVLSSVWEHSSQDGGALLLLLAVADFADDSGRAYPSVPRLARKARMNVRNTQKAIRRVQEAGELEVITGAGPGGCNLYQIHIKGVSPETAPPSKRQGGGVFRGARGVSQATPDPSSGSVIKIPPLPARGAGMSEETGEPEKEVPAELVKAIEWARRATDAATARRTVEEVASGLGFQVERERVVPHRGDGRKGRLDLVLSRNGLQVAVEVDRSQARRKSIRKLQAWQGGPRLLVHRVSHWQDPIRGVKQVVLGEKRPAPGETRMGHRWDDKGSRWVDEGKASDAMSR